MKRILVIDDSTTVRLYHRHLLETIGLLVTEAQNGVEGLEKAMEGAFDLFLVDVNMPVMDGYRFVEEVRTTRDLASTPAIMISTEAKPWDREKAYVAGANLYLLKPVRPEALQNYVKLMVGEPLR